MILSKQNIANEIFRLKKSNINFEYLSKKDMFNFAVESLRNESKFKNRMNRQFNEFNQ